MQYQLLSRVFLIRQPSCQMRLYHDDVMKWKHFPRYWPFVRGIHRSAWIPLTKASDAELCCFFNLPWIYCWVNNSEAGDLRRNRDHHGGTFMCMAPCLMRDITHRNLHLKMCVDYNCTRYTIFTIKLLHVQLKSIPGAWYIVLCQHQHIWNHIYAHNISPCSRHCKPPYIILLLCMH